jgi:hypothetical protein
MKINSRWVKELRNITVKEAQENMRLRLSFVDREAFFKNHKSHKAKD